VLGVLGRDTERFGKLPQYRVAIVEIGPDHHMLAVKLAGDQPAVIPPHGQSFRRRAPHTRQGLGQASYIVDLHERGLPYVCLITITGINIVGAVLVAAKTLRYSRVKRGCPR